MDYIHDTHDMGMIPGEPGARMCLKCYCCACHNPGELEEPCANEPVHLVDIPPTVTN